MPQKGEADVDDEQRLRAGIRALAAEDRRGLEPHPSPDELLAYSAGDLSEVERERLQDHLARCPECTRTILDLESFPGVEPVREEDRLADFDLAAEWRRFQSQADAGPAPRRASPFASARFAYALAASLLLAVIGLSVWIGRLREEAAGPSVNVLVADLVPREEAVERSTDGEETIRIPDWADRLLLILNLAEAPSHAGYRVEIAPQGRPEGREVWSRRGLRPSEDGNFTLEVPRSLLPGERYVVRLYGLQGTGWRVVAEYGVRIQEE